MNKHNILFLKVLFSIFVSFFVSGALAKAENSTCPSKDFSHFLTVFREDVAVQQVFTQYPLPMTVLDLDTPDNKKPFLVKKDELEFPIMTNSEQAKNDGITIAVSKQKGKNVVTESQEGTGFLVHYEFALQNGCWMLVHINDEGA